MSARIQWRSLLSASAALFPIMAAGNALADAPAAASEPQEIIVTATRKEQSISKVPISITAFTGAKMEQLGVKSFADLAKYTPGVVFDPDSKDISIRGVSSNAGAGTTGIYIDDTPIQVRALGLNANNTLPAVFDLDRVEVLRGPQGTLFGAGSEGGTVRYITPQPGLEKYTAYVRAETSFTEHGAPSYELGAAVGGPIIPDVLGFRASVWERHDGGYINRVDSSTGDTVKKDSNWTDTYTLRAALTYKPDSHFSITPTLQYENRNKADTDYYWTALNGLGGNTLNNGNPEKMADYDHFILASVKAEYDFDKAKLISNTSYYDRREYTNGYEGTLYNLSYFQQLLAAGTDFNGNPCTAGACAAGLYPLLTKGGINLPGFGSYSAPNTITNAQSNYTQEIRLQSSDPNAVLSWTVGAFYSANRQVSLEEIHDPQLPALTEYLWGEDMITAWGENLLANGDDYYNYNLGHDRQAAVFTNTTWSVTSQLKIDLGLRYAFTHFDYVHYEDGPQNGGFAVTDPSIKHAKSETPFTPKLNVSYQVTNDDLVYTTVAKGYRVGGSSPPVPYSACQTDLNNLGYTKSPEAYNSDSVWSYEAGTKDKFFDRTLRIDASAYYIDWSHIQQALYLPTCGYQITVNAGAAVSKGFDVQSQFNVTPHLEIDTSLGYTDARFSKTLTPAGASLNIATSGDAVGTVGAPPWTFTIGARYDFDIEGHPAYARLDDEYASKNKWPTIQRDSSNATYDSGLVAPPSTNTLSGRLGVNVKGWDVALFGENLLNVHPQTDLTHQDQFTLLYVATTFRPRVIGVSGSYRF